MVDTDSQNQRIINWTDLSSPATDVPYRNFDSNRKTSSPRSTPYEAHTVAPQTKLAGPRITRKGDTSSHVTPRPSKMEAGGKQCAPRSTIIPTKTCSAIVYRRIERRFGCSLKQPHCKGYLVPSRNKLHIKRWSFSPSKSLKTSARTT